MVMIMGTIMELLKTERAIMEMVEETAMARDMESINL
jgi:hypothetical protein